MNATSHIKARVMRKLKDLGDFTSCMILHATSKIQNTVAALTNCSVYEDSLPGKATPTENYNRQESTPPVTSRS